MAFVSNLLSFRNLEVSNQSPFHLWWNQVKHSHVDKTKLELRPASLDAGCFDGRLLPRKHGEHGIVFFPFFLFPYFLFFFFRVLRASVVSWP